MFVVCICASQCSCSHHPHTKKGALSWLPRDSPLFFHRSRDVLSFFPRTHTIVLHAQVLLPPNARFEVIGSFSAGSGLTIVQCRQVETMLPLIDMGAITLNVEVEHPLVFPFDAKTWSGPVAILRTVPGAWITDWAVFETKMDQLGGLIRTKITAGHADFDSDVYLAHAWGRGADGVSDNHDKARRIHAALTARGYRACFDEKGEVADDAATIHAIERSQLVKFERILFRATRGNLYTRSAEIAQQVRDPAANAHHARKLLPHVCLPLHTRPAKGVSFCAITCTLASCGVRCLCF